MMRRERFAIANIYVPIKRHATLRPSSSFNDLKMPDCLRKLPCHHHGGLKMLSLSRWSRNVVGTGHLPVSCSPA